MHKIKGSVARDIGCQSNMTGARVLQVHLYLILLLFAVTQPAVLAATSATESLSKHRVLSCNIRVALTSDTLTGNGWDARRDACVQVIKKQNADIICLQEVLREQIYDLQDAFPQYSVFGFAGPEMDYEDKDYRGIAKNPIMFSHDRYALLGGGTYWLSETPLIGGSMSWNTGRARHLNWVRLKDKETGNEFRVLNTHLDHVTQEARMGQVKLALKESAQYDSDFPQIFAGDFNGTVNNDLVKSILAAGWTDTWQAIHGDKDAGFTVHRFLGSAYKPKTKRKHLKIDFIFTRGDIKPVASKVIKDEVNGRYPSDHYFLSADLRM